MKIKNTSSRIVHVGTTTILPDEVGAVDDSLKGSPVVSLFISRGDIQIVTGKGAGKAGKGGRKSSAGGADTEDTQGDEGHEDGDKGKSEGESEGESEGKSEGE